MKVVIGPYTNWIGPYQIAEKILFWMDKYEDSRVHAFGEFLAYGFSKPDSTAPVFSKAYESTRSKTWLYKLCEWINDRKKRKVSVKIDKWDTWSMDVTLAMIILPMLKQLNVTKKGAPCVDDSDVPDGIGLRSTEAQPKNNEWDTDGNFFKRWDWVMSELIWTFEQLQPDYDWEDQYRSGDIDIGFMPVTDKLDKNNEPIYLVMTRGPDDTYVCNYEAMQKHQERINNGLRLFGKYYQDLWD
jgi:hypothetical protein